jgi:hypothetical protein
VEPSLESSFDATLRPRVTFRERALATDSAGNLSSWTYADPFAITDFQIHNPALAFGGTWRAKYARAYWNGGRRFATRAGTTATLTTSGSSFALVSALGPDMGRFRVTVDGTELETIDLYSPTRVERYVAWSTSFDSVGEHTITIEVLGTRNSQSTDTRVTVDAFMRIGPSVIGGPAIPG